MITFRYNPTDDVEMGGTFYPIVVCDACLRQIVGPGNVMWVWLDSGEVHPQIWHTHKWPCSRLDDAIRTEYGGIVMCDELHRWLGYLEANTTANEVTP